MKDLIMSSEDATRSRGYRNKNPGNIDWHENNKWQGQLGKEPGGRFAVFDSHENGIRALAALLTTYFDRHKLNTIAKIIGRWAPGVENDTVAYVRHVSLIMDRGAGEVLDLHKYADLQPLVKAIITHELGGQPYPESIIDEGVRRAGVAKPVRSVAAAASTGTGQGAIVGTAVTGAAAVAVQAAPAIAALNGLDWRVGVALILAVGAGVVFWTLNRRKEKPPTTVVEVVAPEASPLGSAEAGGV